MLKSVFNWCLFIYMVLMSVAIDIKVGMASIPFFILSALYCPIIDQKLKLNFTFKRKFILFLIAVVIGFSLNVIKKEMDENKKQAEEVKKLTAIFQEKKSIIYSEVQQLMQNKNWTAAIDVCEKYKDVNDPKLNQLKTEVDRQIRIADIVKELKTIPAKNFLKNRNLYKELVSLVPTSKKYKQKFAYYDKKLQDAKIALDAEIARQKLIEDQFNVWDGSHPALTTLIKSTMHDPDSYKHVSTRYKDEGTHLYVVTQYSGTNGFGARVRNITIAKVDFKGNVIQIIQ